MYLPLRVIDDENGPLGRQAEAIMSAHSSVKDVVVPLVPEAFRDEMRSMPVRVTAGQQGQRNIDGQCALGGSITLTVPPTLQAEKASFVTEYQGVLGHELAHAMRGRYFRAETLGDALVHEGIAIHFGRMLDARHADFVGYTTRHAHTPQLTHALSELEPYLRRTDYNPDAVSSRSGYTLAEQVVGLYIAERQQLPGQLFATPAAEFFQLAQRKLEGRKHSGVLGLQARLSL